MQDTLPPSHEMSSHGSGHLPPPPPSATRKKTRWWIPVVVIVGLFVAILGAMVIGIMIFVASLGSMADFGGSGKSKTIHSNTVLLLNLRNGVEEYSQTTPFSFDGSGQPADLLALLNAIRDAKDDDKIAGILIEAGGITGTTKLAELREALADFKTSKKFIYAYLENASRQQYLLATVADSIFMHQEGILEFNTMGTTGMFFKRLSTSLGVDWHVEQFEEYKSAAEQPSRENWSEPAKRELRVIIEQRQRSFVNTVATARGMDTTTVLSLMNTGVFIPDSALKYKLIDGLSRSEDIREHIARIVDPSDTTRHPKLRTRTLADYANRDASGNPTSTDDGIAIVYASGPIFSGSNSGMNAGIYSKSLIKQLRKAAENKNVKGILLRIDSPGGSALASDEIWEAIRDIRKTKPVYASMSDVAASGGYYIAMACDTIIAHPSTITGSIGVIMAIPNISGTLGKIGITVDTISLGASSQFMNGALPLNPADKVQLRAFGAGVYHRFVDRVAQARHKEFEETRALAKGRVWTGTDAYRNGLIDAVGGLYTSLDMLKKRIGVEAGKKVKIYIYPEKVEFIQALLKAFNIDGADDDDETSAATPELLTRMVQHLAGSNTVAQEVWKSLSPALQQQIRHMASIGAIAAQGNHENVMLMMPDPIPYLP